MPNVSTLQHGHDTSFLYVTTTMCPPYENPKWTNPAWACDMKKTYKIPLNPRVAKVHIPVGEKLEVYDDILYLKEDPKPILGEMGVLKNGVNVFGVGSPCGFSSKCPDEGAPSKWVDAVSSEGHTVDQCGGHAAPTNQYHIHSGIGIVTASDRTACQLPADVPNEHSSLLGWMFDGVGLYGPYSLGGKPPTDLDACGGHTHVLDGKEVYHYHMPYPVSFPWTIGCFSRCPEVSNNPNEFGFLNTNATYGCEVKV